MPPLYVFNKNKRHFTKLLTFCFLFFHLCKEKNIKHYIVFFNSVDLWSELTIVLLIQCITGESRLTVPKVERGHQEIWIQYCCLGNRPEIPSQSNVLKGCDQSAVERCDQPESTCK